MQQLHKHPQDVERAAKILKKARFASKAQFEQRFVKRLSRDEYKTGELVLVCNSAIELSHNRKHQPRYLGPYEVDQKASEKSYTLKDLDGSPFQHRIATSRLSTIHFAATSIYEKSQYQRAIRIRNGLGKFRI